jgi:adenylate cyclase
MSEDSASIRQAETRRLAAIMFTDIVGFSRQMGSDEGRMLRLLEVHNHIIQQAVAEHHGTVIKTVGDAFLVDFPSVVHAVQCAQQIQAQLRTHNADKETAEQIHVRIGIHLGDIVQKDGDVFGDGVNIASRLQAVAEPDTICISDVVYRDVVKKLDVGVVVSLGKPPLKNIAERFQVYALLPEAPQGVRRVLQGQRLKLTRWRRPAQIVAAALVIGWAGVVTYRLLFPTLPTSPPESGAPTSPQPALSLPDKPSIIVLPFDNLSKDPAQEYFSDGLTEVLTGDLSKLSTLFVIASNSAFTYKGKAVKVQDVGREMGVRYVLEGSVLKAEGQVRITAQLIDATTGYQLWAERYDRPLQNVLTLQDEIVQKIVTTLKLQLTVQEQGNLVRKHTDNLEAYDAFLRGMDYAFRYTPETNAEARQWFERAIALDPQYAEAYAWLGRAHLVEWIFQWTLDPQALQQAFELEQQALALDDSLPVAHSRLGHIYAYRRQYEPALAAGRRAIALDPNNAESYAVQAIVLNAAGRPEEALRMMEQALRLNPAYPDWYATNLGTAYALLGRDEEAISAYRDTLLRNPDLLLAHLGLVEVYSRVGREEEARAAAAEVLRISPAFSLEVWKQRAAQKDPDILERQLAALRKAGLK